MSRETEETKNTEEITETEEAVVNETPESTGAADSTEAAEAGEKTETAESAAENGSEENRPEENKKSSYTFRAFINDVLDIAETLCLFMLIFFLMKAYLFDQAIVDGGSMVPTLKDSEKLLYSKIYTPDNNDIVIADNDLLGLIVKRVVAVEGQVVDIRDGCVYVDGQKLDEQVYSEGAVLTASHFVNSETNPRSDNPGLTYPCKVPEGCVFLMGDNRGISDDSRGVRVGFVPVEKIVGKVFMRYSPLSDFKIFNY